MNLAIEALQHSRLKWFVIKMVRKLNGVLTITDIIPL